MKVTCPNCASERGIREILYGMPSEEPDPAVYLIGGCLVEPNQPSHRCITCGWERVKNRFVYDEEEVLGITFAKVENQRDS